MFIGDQSLMFQPFLPICRIRYFLAFLFLVAIIPAAVNGQSQAMVPITPKPSSAAVYTQTVQNPPQPIVATGNQFTAQNSTQGNTAWRAIPPSGAGYQVASNPGTYTAPPGFFVQPAPFDAFSNPGVQGYGTFNAGYNPPTYPQNYQVAQAPQYPQAAPVYVPQSYVAPPGQPYYGAGGAVPYGGANTFQPLWTAQFNVLYMTRAKSNNFPLLVDGAANTIVDMSQLDYGWQTGYDIGLSRRTSPNSNFELRYFQVRSWNADLSSPFNPGDSIVTDPLTLLPLGGTLEYSADSNLNSFEMNFVQRLAVNQRSRFAIGFRWMEISENLLQTLMFGMPTDAQLDIDTNNHLYGLQIAGDTALFNSGCFSMATWLKAGVYANFADQSTFLMTSDGDVLLYNSFEDTVVSFVGEGGIMADLELLPRVSIVGGYQFIYVAGAALAPDQLNNMSSVSTGLVPVALDQSDPFYHGALLGIDIHW